MQQERECDSTDEEDGCGWGSKKGGHSKLGKRRRIVDSSEEEDGGAEVGNNDNHNDAGGGGGCNRRRGVWVVRRWRRKSPL